MNNKEEKIVLDGYDVYVADSVTKGWKAITVIKEVGDGKNEAIVSTTVHKDEYDEEKLQEYIKPLKEAIKKKLMNMNKLIKEDYKTLLGILESVRLQTSDETALNNLIAKVKEHATTSS